MGATYIHTKNKAGDDRLQHHGSGETSVIDIHGHGPLLGCGLLPSSHTTSTQTAVLACWGRGGGGRDACHDYWGRLGSGGERNRVLCGPGARHHIAHYQSLLEEK